MESTNVNTLIINNIIIFDKNTDMFIPLLRTDL